MSVYDEARRQLEESGEPFDEEDVYDLADVLAEINTISSIGWDAFTGIANFEERFMDLE